MIYSMTGYGKAEQSFHDKTITIEMRSLNSKQLDLTLRTPQQYRDRELEIRQTISQRIERGKVDCVVTLSQANTQLGAFTAINRDAVLFYLTEIKSIATECGLLDYDPSHMLSTVLRFPDVMRPSDNVHITEEEDEALRECLRKALDAFCSFREQEGKALETMFLEKLTAIEELLGEVEQYETGRIDAIRQRLENNLQQLSQDTKAAIDRNRLEQEMIYYLEKLDITEEKVRLRNHIRYFRETLGSDTTSVGKKLGFIAQEMGREINTLGSKSNQSEMQIIVVKMKDLLEQIKEQVLNVL